MTAEQAIQMASELRPGETSTEAQYRALTEMENEIGEHMNRHVPANAFPVEITEDNKGKQMRLPERFAMAYVYRLMAERDKVNGEFDRYNNDAALYNMAMKEWKAWYRREHRPKQDHRRGWKLI